MFKNDDMDGQQAHGDDENASMGLESLLPNFEIKNTVHNELDGSAEGAEKEQARLAKLESFKRKTTSIFGSTFREALQVAPVNLKDMISGLDEKAQFSEEDIQKDEYDASNNMKSYLNNFSFRHELPSVYIIDSIFYEPDTTYMLQFVKYVYPRARRSLILRNRMNADELEEATGGDRDQLVVVNHSCDDVGPEN